SGGNSPMCWRTCSTVIPLMFMPWTSGRGAVYLDPPQRPGICQFPPLSASIDCEFGGRTDYYEAFVSSTVGRAHPRTACRFQPDTGCATWQDRFSPAAKACT